MIPYLFRATGARKYRPLARTEQHPYLRPAWNVVQTRAGYCEETQTEPTISDVRKTHTGVASLLQRAVSGALSPMRVQYLNALLDHLSCWHYTLTTTATVINDTATILAV